MKAVFVDDARFARSGTQVLSPSAFPASLWDKYLEVFDQLIVLGRETSPPLPSRCENWVVSSRPEVEFRLVPDLSGLKNAFANRLQAWTLTAEAIEESDAVIARGPGELPLQARKVASKQGKPWAVEVSGCPWDGLWNYGGMKAKMYAPIKALRFRRHVRRAPFALYVTQQFLQRRYPNKKGETCVASNVEIPQPEIEVLHKREAREQGQNGPLVFGLVGSLTGSLKGIDTAIEALANVEDTLPAWQFRVLGPGDPTRFRALADCLEIGDRMHFDGTLPAGEAVRHWLDQVDVYLQPSRREGLPRALVEAMSRGCPAIGSRCAGIPELLEDECLVRPGRPDQLADLLLRVARNTEWRHRQAERNWSKAKEYAADVLEPKRRAFWQRFAEHTAACRDTA